MAVHPCHIVTLVFVFLAGILSMAALGTPWTVGKLSIGSLTAETDLKLFQVCVDAPGQNQCKSWTDVFTSTSNKYCAGLGSGSSGGNSGPTVGDVLNRIRAAEGLAIGAMLAMLVHFIVGILYATGVMQTRIPLIFTGLFPCLCAFAALIMWGTFLGACSTSYCEAYVNQAKQYGAASCGPSSGLILCIVYGIVQFICIWPLFCVARPASANPQIAQGMIQGDAYGQPQAVYVAQPGYAAVPTQPGYYAQPQQAYGQPQQVYGQPQQQVYAQPQQTYAQPQQTYAQPPPTQCAPAA